MNSTGAEKKSQAQPQRNQNATSEIKDFLEKFRKNGISTLAALDKDQQAQYINWAQDIVNQYGFILEENPMKIKNTVDLPCAKEILKIAIKTLLPAYVAKGSDDIVGLLKDRYVRLSAFQEISREDKETIIKESKQIDQKAESTDTSIFPTYLKYMQIIISEQKIFLEDIETFINDLRQLKDS
jgi:hypothetical protein